MPETLPRNRSPRNRSTDRTRLRRVGSDDLVIYTSEPEVVIRAEELPSEEELVQNKAKAAATFWKWLSRSSDAAGAGADTISIGTWIKSSSTTKSRLRARHQTLASLMPVSPRTNPFKQSTARPQS